MVCTCLFVALALNRKPPCIGNLDYSNKHREREKKSLSVRDVISSKKCVVDDFRGPPRSRKREKNEKKAKACAQSSTFTSIFVMYLLEYLRERGVVVRGGSTRRHDEKNVMSFFL